MDGLLDQRTAKVKAPYLEDYPDLGIGDNGMNYFTEDRLTRYMQELQNLGGNKGYNFLIHTIGDQGVHEALNAIQRSAVNKASSHLCWNKLT